MSIRELKMVIGTIGGGIMCFVVAWMFISPHLSGDADQIAIVGSPWKGVLLIPLGMVAMAIGIRQLRHLRR